MKIKLSKSQWETISKTAGWTKKAQMTSGSDGAGVQKTVPVTQNNGYKRLMKVIQDNGFRSEVHSTPGRGIKEVVIQIPVEYDEESLFEEYVTIYNNPEFSRMFEMFEHLRKRLEVARGSGDKAEESRVVSQINKSVKEARDYMEPRLYGNEKLLNFIINRIQASLK